MPLRHSQLGMEPVISSVLVPSVQWNRPFFGSKASDISKPYGTGPIHYFVKG